MTRRPKVSWTFLIDGGRTLRCDRCGGTAPITLPIPVKEFCRKVDGFNLMHADCKEPAKVAGPEGS